jgi:hypothetical protein
MNARLLLAGVLAALALLAGCQSSTVGTPVKRAETPTEPNFPTSRPTRPTAAPPRTLTPAPTSTAVPPGADVLTPDNGYVFIETKSGKTRCQLNEEEVGVRVTPNGEVSWRVGNWGDIPAVTLDYRIYHAVGWTIDAREDGTRFTNDRTAHGMVVAIEGVQAF